MTLAFGTTLAGRFHLQQPLGEGAFGSVWEAFDVDAGKTFALKILHKHALQHGRRLLREARVLLLLRHPSVVTVHEMVDDEVHGPILVMDLLRGENLRARLERDETLPVADVLAIGRAVAGGLVEAHAQGAIHRDLKPENLFLQTLLDEQPSDEPTDFGLAPTEDIDEAALPRSAPIRGIKILDFGVVKLVALGGDASMLSSTLTRKGLVVGTVGYMAPEQYWDDGDIDGRADLWSLGAILYECLSGGLPVDAALPNQFLFRLKRQGIVPLDQINPTIPPALCSLVSSLLAFDREQRPATATAVLAALDAIALR
jgi:serine/threonine-protein kinase